MDNKQKDIEELKSLINEIQSIADDVNRSCSGVGEQNCYDSLMLLKKEYEKIREKLEKEM